VAWGNTDILDILKRGSKPTFVNRTRTQVIDISLASSNIWHEVQNNRRVSSEVYLSDHQIIHFEVSSDLKPSHQYTNPQSTNWEFFEKELKSELWGYYTDLNGVQAIENSVVRVLSMLHMKSLDI
jgi:hypothetical protein